MRLHPGSTLQLETLHGSSSNMSFDLVEGRILGVEEIQIDVQQGATPQTYKIDLAATGFALGSIMRQSLRIPTAWPDAFETLIADMTITFDRPWDRTALEHNRPQPRHITVDKVTAIWADLGINFAAQLQIAAGGVPSGTLDLQAQNWKRMLDLASAGGTLPLQMRQQLETILSLLSGLSGSSDTLDVTITVENGQMRMGFIPLGPMPNIVLR